MRAVECLKRADVILYDYLANPVALEHAAPSSELVCLGDHRTGRTLQPDEITARMLAEARAGKTVVRLKGGDPSIFGRGADEVQALRDAGIPFEIVPGITAALAAAAYCEIPVTHHDGASAVALIAGRERRGKDNSNLDFGGLAGFPGTLVFYMGVTSAARWSRALLENGKPPRTPVAIIRWCTRAQQRMVRCTLDTVEKTIEQEGLRPPVLFVVGDVVDKAPALSWFTARPLFGERVLVAGSRGTSRKLRDRLAELGAEVIPLPAIQVTDPPDWTPVDAALETLDRYDWLVFSSGTGVDFFLQRLYDMGGDARRLGRMKVAAIGTGTADQLARHRLRADLVPERFDAESLARDLIERARRRTFLLARAGGRPSLLADALDRAGVYVTPIVVHGNVEVKHPNPYVAAALASGEIDWITVASSSTARSLSRLYGESLRHARLASIGPLTSATLRNLGFEPAVEACPHTVAGLIDAIQRAHLDNA